MHAESEYVPFAAHVVDPETPCTLSVQVAEGQCSEGSRQPSKLTVDAKKVLWLRLPASNLQPYFWSEDLLSQFVLKASESLGQPLSPDEVTRRLKLWWEDGLSDDHLSPYMFASTCFEVWANQVKRFQQKKLETKSTAGPYSSVLKGLRASLDKSKWTDVCRKLFPGRFRYRSLRSVLHGCILTICTCRTILNAV